MKINRIRLKGIRCFDEIEINLGGKSALIIGDNGAGKSTVIRSIAMGLCDESSTAALFRELYGETVREGKRSGEIQVDLSDGTVEYSTLTEVKSFRTWERIEQRVSKRSRKDARFRDLTQEEFPWDRIFAAGYGAGIRVQGIADYDDYFTGDAVHPLFVYDVPLQNPELVVRRLVNSARREGNSARADRVLTSISTLLWKVLQLRRQDRVELTRTGIAVRGPWGRAELLSLGDGYRSTVTWILDLLSWWFLQTPHGRRSVKPDAIRGIVLVDEVEQHLHPRWQRNIMQLLTASFPKVQFIATTHSPLVASGCEGIPVHRLDHGAHKAVEHKVETPFGWLAEDVYEMMGLPSSRSAAFISNVLNEYDRLDEKRLASSLSRNERRRLTALRKEMRNLPGDDPIRLTTELTNLAQRARRLKGASS